jgi:hypothetical protein
MQTGISEKTGRMLFLGSFYEKKTRRVLPNRAADRCGHHSNYGRHRGSELSQVALSGE